MKVIDLLKLIANGEEIKRFKYYGGTYIYDEETKRYWFEDMWFNLDFDNLNDEVEVIEDTPKEDKKIEKLKYIKNGEFAEVPSNVILMNKINEIIDRLNGDSDD